MRRRGSSMAAAVSLCGCHVDDVFGSGLKLVVCGLLMRLLF